MKSSVSWFRQKVLGKGSSEHDGRGSYWMETNLSFSAIEENIEKMRMKYPDMIEEVVEETSTTDPSNRKICVVLKGFEKDRRLEYRRFIVHSKHPWCANKLVVQCVMARPRLAALYM